MTTHASVRPLVCEKPCDWLQLSPCSGYAAVQCFSEAVASVPPSQPAQPTALTPSSPSPISQGWLRGSKPGSCSPQHQRSMETRRLAAAMGPQRTGQACSNLSPWCCHGDCLHFDPQLPCPPGPPAVRGVLGSCESDWSAGVLRREQEGC